MPRSVTEVGMSTVQAEKNWNAVLDKKRQNSGAGVQKKVSGGTQASAKMTPRHPRCSPSCFSAILWATEMVAAN